MSDIKVSSFLNREWKLLRYVKYPDIVDLSKLPEKDEFYELYEKDIPEREVPCSMKPLSQRRSICYNKTYAYVFFDKSNGVALLLQFG